MEFRSFQLSRIETREKDDTGYISGLVSESELYEPGFGTTFKEGAWRRTIDSRSGTFPLLWMHAITQPVGLGHFSESKRGLELDDGAVDLTTEVGRLVYSGAKRGYIDTMSQGFDFVRTEPDPDASHPGGLLVWEVNLGESSFVTRGFAGNPGAMIETVRAATSGIERVNAAIRSGAKDEFRAAFNELKELVNSRGVVATDDFDLEVPAWANEVIAELKRASALLKGGDPSTDTPTDENSIVIPDPLEEMRQLKARLQKSLQR